MNSKLSLRQADINDLPLLKYWDEQDHILLSESSDNWAWETDLLEEPPWREQLIAELQSRPLGFLQIIDPAMETTHYWDDIGPYHRAVDLWIGDAKDLGQGYGTQMMLLTLARCFNQPNVTTVWVDPLAKNHRAHRFYEKLRFEFVEDRIFGKDHCKVYRISRKTWEKNHATPR